MEFIKHAVERSTIIDHADVEGFLKLESNIGVNVLEAIATTGWFCVAALVLHRFNKVKDV